MSSQERAKYEGERAKHDVSLAKAAADQAERDAWIASAAAAQSAAAPASCAIVLPSPFLGISQERSSRKVKNGS
jgi:hypothetical protein